AIVSGPDLKDAKLQPVIANPNEVARAWCERNGVLPINHMLVVKESLLNANPSAVREVFRLLHESKQAAPVSGNALDPIQFGVKNIRRSLELIIGYSMQQKLIPQKFSVDELFNEVTGGLH
ncbi:MAG TPA: phosphate ABC transporter substrate-binding protein, partial [Acidobacteriota bacterium]|nr:phosphate ABC transporter substrate-binding protein [Acidobacteriota bacterium]